MRKGMTGKAAFVAASLVAGLGTPALAESGNGTRATAPVYDSVVVFALPAGFEHAHEAEEAGHYILELVPQGQTVGDWQEMLTLTGADNLQQRAGLTAVEMVDWGLEEIARGYEAGCRHPITVEAFNDAPPAGAEDGVLAHIGCPEVTQTGQSEQMMLWITVREGDLFTLQMAERGPAQETLEFEPPKWFERFELLAQMSLCAPVPGEEPPYPSCLD